MATIMIVDDNADIASTLQTLVQKIGHTVEITHNGQEFLDRVDAVNPELVLLDVMMPGLSTFEILDELEKRKCGAKVVMLTVVRFSEKEQMQLLQRVNVVDYIRKPFDVPQLISCLNRLLRD